MKFDPDEEWGTTAIARYLDTSVVYADQLTKKPGFPEPFMKGSFRKWRAQDIVDWDAQRGHAKIKNRAPLRAYHRATAQEREANRRAAHYRHERGEALRALNRAGMSAADLAAITGLSPATVYTLMNQENA